MEDQDKKLEEEEEQDESVKDFLKDIDKITGAKKEEAQKEPAEDFLEDQLKGLPHDKANELRGKKYQILPQLTNRGWKTREGIALAERQSIDKFFEEDFEDFETQFKKRHGREPESLEDMVAFLEANDKAELAELVMQPRYISQVHRQWSKVLVRRSLEEGAGFEEAFEAFLPGVEVADLKDEKAFEKAFVEKFPEVKVSVLQQMRFGEALEAKQEAVRKDQETRWNNTARILGAKKTFAFNLSQEFAKDEIWEREAYLQQLEAEAESINESFKEINERKDFLRKTVPTLGDYNLEQSLADIEEALDFKDLDPRLAFTRVLQLQSQAQALYVRVKDKESTASQEAFEAKYQIKELVFPGKMLHEEKVSKSDFQLMLRKRLIFPEEILNTVDDDFAIRSNELFRIYEQKHEAQKGFDRQIDVFHKRCDRLGPLGATYFQAFKEEVGERLRPLREKTPILADFESHLPELESAMISFEQDWDNIEDLTPELESERASIFESMISALKSGKKVLGSFFTQLKKLTKKPEEDPKTKPKKSKEDQPEKDVPEVKEVVEEEVLVDEKKKEVLEVVQDAEEEAVKKETQIDIESLLEEEDIEDETIIDFGLSAKQWELLNKEGVQHHHIKALYDRGIATDRWQWEKLLRLSYDQDKDLAKGFERLETLLQDPDNKPLETLLKRADLDGYEGVVLSSLCCLTTEEFRTFRTQDMEDFHWQGNPRNQARRFVQFLWQTQGVEEDFQTFAGNEYKSVIDKFDLDEVIEEEVVEEEVLEPEMIEEDVEEEVLEEEDAATQDDTQVSDEEELEEDLIEEEIEDVEEEVEEVLEEDTEEVEESEEEEDEIIEETQEDEESEEAVEEEVEETEEVSEEDEEGEEGVEDEEVIEEEIEDVEEEVEEVLEEDTEEVEESEEEEDEIIEETQEDEESEEAVEEEVEETEEVSEEDEEGEEGVEDEEVIEEEIEDVEEEVEEVLEEDTEEPEEVTKEESENEEVMEEDESEDEIIEETQEDDESEEAVEEEVEETEEASEEDEEDEEGVEDEDSIEEEVEDVEEEVEEVLEEDTEESEEEEDMEEVPETLQEALEEEIDEDVEILDAEGLQNGVEDEEKSGEEGENVDNLFTTLEEVEETEEEIEEVLKETPEEDATEEVLEAPEDQEVVEEEVDEIEEEVEEVLEEEDEQTEVLEEVIEEEESPEEDEEVEAEQQDLLERLEQEEKEAELEAEKVQTRQQQQIAVEDEKTEEEAVIEDEGKNVSDWLLNFRDQMRAQQVLEGGGGDRGLSEQVAEERIEVSVNRLDYSTLLVKLKSMALLSEADYQLWFKILHEVFVTLDTASLGEILSRFERYVSVLEPQARVSKSVDRQKQEQILGNAENVLAGLIWEWHQSRDAKFVSISLIADQLNVRMNNRLIKIGAEWKAN